MNRIMRTTSVFIFLTLIVIQFNNCDVYSQKSVFERQEVIQNCLDAGSTGCFSQEAEMLEIRINTENDLKVATSALSSFFVSGDCNEGNFPNNEIDWNLIDDGTTLAKAATAKTGKCINGRFSVEIILPQAFNSSDLKLEVQIIGLDDQAQRYTNPFLGKSSIFIQPDS